MRTAVLYHPKNPIIPGADISSHDIEQATKETALHTLGVALDEIHLESHFEKDLQADSLDVVELVMAYEEQFGLEVPDNAAETILTVGNLVDYVFTRYAGDEDGKYGAISSAISFRLGPDGKIEVACRGTDGSWLYADATQKLPSGIYATVFNRWADVLKELEELVNDATVDEHSLQTFFQKHPALLRGDNYDVIVPQAVIKPDDRKVNWRADFVLQPRDQVAFCKIVELKLPTQPIVKREQSGHAAFYYQLNTAIQQLRDYGSAFDSDGVREKFKRAYGIEVFKPDLQLIVGRKWEVTHANAMREKQRQASVEIIDWDTTIDRLRRKLT